MAEVTINISRTAIYSIVEGISVTISQHNGGTPTYEQLWASEDESRKLDIWYREAISDLERRLMRWVAESSGQFDLTANGSDYVLTLNLSRFWPTILQGVLKNKIQDYLAHSVTAGWLNDFDGLTVKQDYQAMAAQDVSDLIDIICTQRFGFTERSRTGEDTSKSTEDIGADKRQGEDTSKSTEDIGADKRQGDSDKNTPGLVLEAGYRRKDNVKKAGMDDKPVLARERTDRHKDNAVVDIRKSHTDMSGTGLACQMEDPSDMWHRRIPGCRITRPAMGVGYTPSPQHPPVPEPPTPKPPMEPVNYEEPPVHSVPPRFAPPPPFHANGKGWSDEAVYDEEAERRFIESHICGQHSLEDDNLFVPEED